MLHRWTLPIGALLLLLLSPATVAGGLTTVESVAEVQLDRLVYRGGDQIGVSIRFAGSGPMEKEIPVMITAGGADDLEVLMVSPGTDGRWTSTTVLQVQPAMGVATPLDGTLMANPGEMIVALYYGAAIQQSQDANDVESDFALMEDPGFTTSGSKLMPELAMSIDEQAIPPGGKRIGTISRFGGAMQLAVDELIIYPRSQAELADFLKLSGGKIRMSDLLKQEANTRSEPDSYLVSVDPSRGDVAHLDQLRALYGEDDLLIASNEATLGIYALALEYQMQGYVVGVNPRLHTGDAPRPREGSGPVPVDLTDPLFDIPSVWAMNALWEADDQRIRVAFLDQGFAPNPDFRADTGPRTECDLEGESLLSGLLPEIDCSPGTASAPATVGNSGFGNRSWHGTGVVTTAAGVVNNGWGNAGTGGQVVVPMLYRTGLASYAFELGLGIRKATLDGASIINISAGYPCRIITNIGIEPTICDPAGRALLCSAIAVALNHAMVMVCTRTSLLLLVPGVGVAAPALQAACIAATIAVGTAITACTALVAAGDTRGAMTAGVDFALARGIPVVSIAGNTIGGLPPGLGPVISTTNRDAGDWEIVPGTIPGVICVGASNDNMPYDNEHFAGARVDIWAPIPHPYMAPPTIDVVTDGNLQVPQPWLGGTSASTPYIAGLMADMMAINPFLNPRNPVLSDFERRSIPTTIREMIVNTAHTVDEMTSLGFVDPTGLRGRLVNPMAAMRLATVGVLPEIELMGYTTGLNLDDDGKLPGQDTRLLARDMGVLSSPRTATGTILTVRGEPPMGVAQRDDDWYSVGTPLAPGTYVAEIHLKTPRWGTEGDLHLTGTGLLLAGPPTLTARETEFVYRSPLLVPGARYRFKVDGDLAGSDNVYILTAPIAQRVGEAPEADIIDRDNPDPATTIENAFGTPRRGATLGGPGSFPWQQQPGLSPTGGDVFVIEIPGLNFHTSSDTDSFVITELPPSGSETGFGCPPELEISFGENTRLQVYTPSGRLLLDTYNSPARIPHAMIATPLRFVVSPAEAGIVTDYDLRMRYVRPDERRCRLSTSFTGGADMIPAGASGIHRFPQWYPEPEELAQVKENLLINPLKGDPDPTARIDPAHAQSDYYIVKWNGQGTFHAVATLASGKTLRMRLLDTNGKEFAMGETGFAYGDAGPAVKSDWSQFSPTHVVAEGPPASGIQEQLYGPGEIQLIVPGLQKGDYILEVSGGTLSTEFMLLLPRGALTGKTVATEDFLPGKPQQ